jgi:hypothetical protein
MSFQRGSRVAVMLRTSGAAALRICGAMNRSEVVWFGERLLEIPAREAVEQCEVFFMLRNFRAGATGGVPR